jgi:hypothetical protein
VGRRVERRVLLLDAYPSYANGVAPFTRLRWCGFALLDMIHAPRVGGSSG